MAYRSIDADKVSDTLRKLEARIGARFPNSSLRKVGLDLVDLADHTKARALALAKPNLGLRLAIGVVLGGGFALVVYLSLGLHLEMSARNVVDLVSGIEASFNLILLIGAAVLSLVTIEGRMKRAAALKALHELRSLIHVIDMHQLTKDPVMLGAQKTKASPEHALSAFELTRYLDYCSELLSLCGKLAAIYAQDIADPAVIETASDLEQLATNLSQKVWQKITNIRAT